MTLIKQQTDFIPLNILLPPSPNLNANVYEIQTGGSNKTLAYTTEILYIVRK